MFLLLTLGVVFFSWICNVYGLGVPHPHGGGEIGVQSLLSPEGVRWLLRHVVTNFTRFGPLGLAMVAMFGMGVAWHSGFAGACMRRWAGSMERRCAKRVILMVILLGLLSNVAGESGYVLLLPVSAVLFRAARLHPVAGIITAYVSVSCGYNANFLITTLDSMLADTTREAAEWGSVSAARLGPLCNYWFLSFSTILLLFVIYRVTRSILLPRMGEYGEANASLPVQKLLSRKERRALSVAFAFGAIYAAVILFATFSPWGILRSVGGGLMRSPFMYSLLFLLSFGIGVMGMVYGFVSGRYRTDNDVAEGLTHPMKMFGGYLVLAFFASQMFACLEYSRLVEYVAVTGADWIVSFQASGPCSLVLLTLFTALLNTLMVSSTAKWALLSFIFVPFMADAGISPDVVQCAYRIGDSATNAITPFMLYAPLVLAYMRMYDRNATFATLFRYAWIYSFAILPVWAMFFLFWYVCGLPLGI